MKCLTVWLSEDDLWCNVVRCAKHLAVLELPVSIHVVIHHGGSDCEEWRREEMGRDRKEGEEGEEGQWEEEKK